MLCWRFFVESEFKSTFGISPKKDMELHKTYVKALDYILKSIFDLRFGNAGVQHGDATLRLYLSQHYKLNELEIENLFDKLHDEKYAVYDKTNQNLTITLNGQNL